uniref:ATP-binding cassette sub-family B member 10, mitochondrial n=1 Tax=Timema monikensis TaxID=170555 RepID=A0A7R9DZ43_9NEOP|nr:unnamed protein product [Timema monikensis]
MLLSDFWHDSSRLFDTIQFTRIGAIRFSLVNKVYATTIIIIFPSRHIHVSLAASHLIALYLDLDDSTSTTACDTFVLDPISDSNEIESDAGDFMKHVKLFSAGFPGKFLKNYLDLFSSSTSNFHLFRPPAPFSFFVEEIRFVGHFRAYYSVQEEVPCIAWESWLKFFQDAGIPPAVAARYACTFAEHRLQSSMLMDLTKEDLQDLNITLKGDMIAILKHAKTVHEQNMQEMVMGMSSPSIQKVRPVKAPTAFYSNLHVKGRFGLGQPTNQRSTLALILNWRCYDSLLHWQYLLQDLVLLRRLKKIQSQTLTMKSPYRDLKSHQTSVMLTSTPPPRKKPRQVLPQHEGAYKIIMPAGTTPRTQQLLAKQGLVPGQVKKTVFDRLGDGHNVISSTTEIKSPKFTITMQGSSIVKTNTTSEKASSVFSRLGGKTQVSSSVTSSLDLKTSELPHKPELKSSLPYAAAVSTMRADEESSPKARVSDTLVGRLGAPTQIINKPTPRIARIVKSSQPEEEMVTLIGKSKLVALNKKPMGRKNKATAGILANPVNEQKLSVKSRLGIGLHADVPSTSGNISQKKMLKKVPRRPVIPRDDFEDDLNDYDELVSIEDDDDYDHNIRLNNWGGKDNGLSEGGEDIEDSSKNDELKLRMIINLTRVLLLSFIASSSPLTLGLASVIADRTDSAICLLLVSSTVTMAVPFCLGKVIDIIYTADAANTRENLNKLSGVLLLIFLVGSLCNFGRVYLMSTSGQRITQQLRKTVFGSIVRQEVAFFDINKTGELVNRLSADTTLVSNSITQNVSDGLRSSIMAVAGISMMFYTSSQLAIVGLAIVPPVAGMAIVYGRYVRKITKSVQDSLADATQVAEEKIANIRTVKMFSQEERENQMYAEKIQKVLELLYREARASSLFYGLTGLSGNIIILTVLYYGGVMVSDQHITVGNLSAFLLYAAYIGVSIGGLSSFYSELNKGLGASTRLWELIDRTPAIPLKGGLVPITEPRGHITFQNITFRYPARPDSVILKDFTLDIMPGSVTAVVGASGSGKSTLASLLLRLYDPESGEVMLDGTSIRQIQVDWLRKHVGVVSQEPVLFSSSIKDNILYGANDPSQVTTEQLIAVTKEANAHNFIVNTFSEGFNTKVGERGVMLSGGQKQRVAIARALIKNPRILLLDEATSALDAESEHLVQEALERIMKGRTVLTIAHRLSTIKNADQIAVLEHGQIVEIGTYTTLMSHSNGAFRKLVQHQMFQGDVPDHITQTTALSTS